MSPLLPPSWLGCPDPRSGSCKAEFNQRVELWGLLPFSGVGHTTFVSIWAFPDPGGLGAEVGSGVFEQTGVALSHHSLPGASCLGLQAELRRMERPSKRKCDSPPREGHSWACLLSASTSPTSISILEKSDAPNSPEDLAWTRRQRMRIW